MRLLRASAVLAAAALALFAPSAIAAPLPGQTAPAFAGKDLDGRPLDLKAYGGHVLVVNFWATWCPPCRAEMPLLDAVYKRHVKDGVIFVGLSADRRRDLGEVRRAAASISYPAALLSDAQSNGFGAPSSLPATYVVDAEGTLRFVFSEKTGALTPEALERAIASLLAPKA